MFHLGGGGGGHNGPGWGRINLWKCTKNQAKPGNSTLNIAFHKTGMIFNESPQKIIKIRPFSHFCLSQGLNGHFGLLEPKKQPAEQPNGHLPENEGIQSCWCTIMMVTKYWDDVSKKWKYWYWSNSTTRWLKLAHCAPPTPFVKSIQKILCFLW